MLSDLAARRRLVSGSFFRISRAWAPELLCQRQACLAQCVLQSLVGDLALLLASFVIRLQLLQLISSCCCRADGFSSGPPATCLNDFAGDGGLELEAHPDRRRRARPLLAAGPRPYGDRRSGNRSAPPPRQPASRRPGCSRAGCFRIQFAARSRSLRRLGSMASPESQRSSGSISPLVGLGATAACFGSVSFNCLRSSPQLGQVASPAFASDASDNSLRHKGQRRGAASWNARFIGTAEVVMVLGSVTTVDCPSIDRTVASGMTAKGFKIGIGHRLRTTCTICVRPS